MCFVMPASKPLRVIQEQRQLLRIQSPPTVCTRAFFSFSVREDVLCSWRCPSIRLWSEIATRGSSKQTL